MANSAEEMSVVIRVVTILRDLLSGRMAEEERQMTKSVEELSEVVLPDGRILEVLDKDDPRLRVKGNTLSRKLAQESMVPGETYIIKKNPGVGGKVQALLFRKFIADEEEGLDLVSTLNMATMCVQNYNRETLSSFMFYEPLEPRQEHQPVQLDIPVVVEEEEGEDMLTAMHETLARVSYAQVEMQRSINGLKDDNMDNFQALDKSVKGLIKTIEGLIVKMNNIHNLLRRKEAASHQEYEKPEGGAKENNTANAKKTRIVRGTTRRKGDQE